MFAPLSLEGEYTLPEYITSIDYDAFYGCSGLTSVIIPNSVNSIGTSAFKGCSGLTSVIIPNSVKSIGSEAFKGCSGLTSVIISNSVTDIRNDAFDGCRSLEKSAYPHTLENPFPGGIVIAYDPDSAIIEDGWIYNTDKSNILFAPLSLEGAYTLPEYITSIDERAFYGCSGLTSVVTLSATPPSIKDNAFNGLYNKINLYIPQEGIAKYLSTNWTLFKNIGIEGSEQKLSTYNDGVLNYRLIPASSKDDNNLAFIISGNYSGEIAIPERFTDDSDTANPTRYYIEGIGYKAFSSTDVSKIEFNSRINLKFIGDYSFSDCNKLTEISIPATVESIGNYAFYNTYDLELVDMKEGLKSIGDYAFASEYKRWNNNNPIFIPSSVSSIGTNAFENFGCSEVQITDLEAWCKIDFATESSNPLSYSYKLILNGEVLTDLVIPEGLNAINPYTFSHCRDLKTVKIGTSVKKIGEQAFYDCRNLNNLTIPATIETIGVQAIPADSIHLNDGLAPIELAKNAFYKDVTDLYLGRPISQYWGGNNSKLKTLVVGNTVEEIPEGCFSNSFSLDSITLGNSLKTIGDEAFKDCTQLEEIIVPPSVETIGASAFANNKKLSSIIMGHNVTTIGEKAFEACPAKTVSITAQTPPTAPNNTFSNYSGKLYLQGQAAVDAYYDAYTCWDRFNGYVMIEATDIDVDTKPISGKAGDTFQLTATLMPENVTLPQIFWRSTNPEIATVDDNGLVTLQVNLSEVLTRVENDEEGTCKIIAESLYADGPVVEITVFNSDFTDVQEIMEETVSSEIDYNAPIEVYNINGMKVANTTSGLAKGIYIVRQGKIAKKIAVK